MAPGRGPAWLVTLFLVVGCSRVMAPAVTPATAPPMTPPPPAAETPAPRGAAVGMVQTGRASWYGQAHHGRRTASGEVYDMNELTAAHRTLPLGSRVLVTNTASGEAVEVRINDRGPFAEGRILDLSHAAGRILGAVGSGVIPVRLRVVALPGGAETAAAGQLTVQVAAFSTRERAEAVRQALARDGVEATIAESVVGEETYYRVRVGSYADRPAAEAAARRLAERGLRAVIVDR